MFLSFQPSQCLFWLETTFSRCWFWVEEKLRLKYVFWARRGGSQTFVASFFYGRQQQPSARIHNNFNRFQQFLLKPLLQHNLSVVDQPYCLIQSFWVVLSPPHSSKTATEIEEQQTHQQQERFEKCLRMLWYFFYWGWSLIAFLSIPILLNPSLNQFSFQQKLKNKENFNLK